MPIGFRMEPHLGLLPWTLVEVGSFLESPQQEENNTPSHFNEPATATFVESDSDGDVLFATSTNKEGISDWVLDSGYAFHMCPHKDWFSTYDPVNSTSVHIGNNAQCIAGMGTVKVKIHDGAIRALSNVRHVPNLKHNLISLGTL